MGDFGCLLFGVVRFNNNTIGGILKQTPLVSLKFEEWGFLNFCETSIFWIMIHTYLNMCLEADLRMRLFFLWCAERAASERYALKWKTRMGMSFFWEFFGGHTVEGVPSKIHCMGFPGSN